MEFLGRGETNPTLAGIDQRLFNPLGKLFGAWCRESLYRGPRCAGDPHGAALFVIGWRCCLKEVVSPAWIRGADGDGYCTIRC